MRTAATVAATLGGGLAVLAVAFVWSFRTGFRPVLDLVRRMNRRLLNPRQLRTAGQPGAGASVVHHVGRTSGRAYHTPVVAQPVADGFVVALPYGRDADWVRNVVTADRAEVEHEGRRVPVDRPTFLTALDANHHFDGPEQRTHALFGLDDFLHLRTADGQDTA